MNSIVQRLILTLWIGLAVLLIGAGLGIYYITRAVLLRDFDALLRSTLRNVTGMVQSQVLKEYPSNKPIQFELRHDPLVFLQVWTLDGQVLGRSASLADKDLVFQKPAIKQEHWLDFTLPNGRQARALAQQILLITDQLKVQIESDRRSSAEREKRNLERVKWEQIVSRLPQSIVIMAAMDRTELNSALQRLALVLIMVGLLALLLIILLVAFLSRRGLAPLQQVAEQAGQIDATTLNFRFPTKQLPAELKVICERLNDLLSRLELAFIRERCFSADVAHELRTPITELRTLSEIALKWPYPDSNTTNAFQDALDIALKMQGIVTGLLAIARCEAGTQAIVREPVPLASLIRKLWEPFQARAAAKSLRVQFSLPEPILLETDCGMLSLILVNLLSNAVEYTPTKGTIDIQLLPKDPGLDCRVTNTAPALTAQDLPHLFDRFWRKDTARSSSEHCGIGLSVARAFSLALGLRLEASLSTDGQLTMRLATVASL